MTGPPFVDEPADRPPGRLRMAKFEGTQMSTQDRPAKYKPSASGMLDFQPVSLESARAALDELPSGVARVLDAVPGYWARNRRAALATDRALTGRAMDWTLQLPENIRPRITSERYPRIVNAIAAAWPDAEGRTQLFDHLLNDRRSGRRGFPIDVEREISALCLYASTLS